MFFENFQSGSWVIITPLTYSYCVSSGRINDRLNGIFQLLFNSFPSLLSFLFCILAIKYNIPTASHVTLNVYDVLGREVATLVNEEKPAGNYETQFSAANLPSGVYFYRIKAGNYSAVKKMILMK